MGIEPISPHNAGVSPDDVKITGHILIALTQTRTRAQAVAIDKTTTACEDISAGTEKPVFPWSQNLRITYLCEHGPPLGWPLRAKLRAVIFEKASPLGGLASRNSNVYVNG